jgi:glycosyltransferase involved in cell wall biosynthesis
MKVLHAISGLDPVNGGPTFALMGLAEAQVRAGLDVSIAVTWQTQRGNEEMDWLRARGVKVHAIGPARGKLSKYPELEKVVDDHVGAADVVHVHALWEDIQHFAARAAQRLGKPYVWTPHGMLSPWAFDSGTVVNRVGKRLFMALRVRKNLERAAALNFTTQAERDLAARLKLSPPAIIEPVGIDLAEFENLPPRGAFRAKWNLAERPMLLFLGRLSPQKGLDVLIPAFAQLCDAGAALVLAGPDYDNYTAVVKSLVGRHKLGERVVFTGMLKGRERIEALVDADLFVLASRHENFGIVVAEAMACGVPCVISQEVNIWRDVVDAGAGGAAAPEAGAFAAEVEKWLADPVMRRAAGEKGRRAALERYGWDAIARRWVEHYRGIAGENRGAR